MRRLRAILLVGFVGLVWLGTPVILTSYPSAHAEVQTWCVRPTSSLRGWQPLPRYVTYE